MGRDDDVSSTISLSFQGPLLCVKSWEGDGSSDVKGYLSVGGMSPWSGSDWLILVVVHRRGVCRGFLKWWLVLSGARPPGERESVGGVLSLWPGSPAGSLMMSDLQCQSNSNGRGGSPHSPGPPRPKEGEKCPRLLSPSTLGQTRSFVTLQASAHLQKSPCLQSSLGRSWNLLCHTQMTMVKECSIKTFF